MLLFALLLAPTADAVCKWTPSRGKTLETLYKSSGSHLGTAKMLCKGGRCRFTCETPGRKAWCHVGKGALKAAGKQVTWQCIESEGNAGGGNGGGKQTNGKNKKNSKKNEVVDMASMSPVNAARRATLASSLAVVVSATAAALLHRR